MLDGTSYMSVSEVVDLLGCNRQTVLRWIARGYLKGVKFAGSMGWRIERQSVESFIQNRSVIQAKREIGHG